jgi:hypothetical protein
MRRFAGERLVGAQLTPGDKNKVVHAVDVDDTLTMKPDGFDNTGMTKDQFFDAARDFPADPAVVDLVRMLADKGDRIAIATARPAERLEETMDWLNRNNVPYDQIMLSNGLEPSGVAKQEMLMRLQDEYQKVGTLLDDSPYNIEGARLQGIDAIHLNKNEQYWNDHPEKVYKVFR